MRSSLASRLSGLYVTLLGVTVLLVILTSSLALVYVLNGFTRDIASAKHDEARNLAELYHEEGLTLKQSASYIVGALSGFGLRVTVYDNKGIFLAGDRTLRPTLLDRVLAGHFPLSVAPPSFSRAMLPRQSGNGAPFGFPPGPATGASGKPFPIASPGFPGTVGALVYNDRNPTHYQAYLLRRLPNQPPHFDPFFSLVAVNGGYVAFATSTPLLLISLAPYWRVVLTIAIVAVVLSWLLARIVARQALEPLNEVTASLQALAAGDFTQRRFMIAGGGDEIAVLTSAYNDAAAGVAAAMNERLSVEERMRQFVADAGHELRTPLTVISGYIDVLRRGAIEEPNIARQILGTMSIEKEHMRVLIDRLMRLARLDAESPPRDEVVDVAELLRSQCDAARRLDERRNIDYSVEGIERIHADRTELGEAIWNVVENALKYAPDAPIHLRATRGKSANPSEAIGGTAKGENVVITISDEGPGMSEVERIHAFERFYRGDVRGEITGTGLGLAIAKRAVERAGGTISIDSAPNRGTIVTITLPQP